MAGTKLILVLTIALGLSACRPAAARSDLSRRIDSISREVERIRGQRFERPVEGRTIPREALLRVYDSASLDLPDPADSAWDRMLWTLGFTDSLGALDGVADSVDEASIQAFYTRGVLWVVDQAVDSSELDVTIAHELTHALQDQRWNLPSLYARCRGLDQRLALQYLLEGEARLVETLYARRHSPPQAGKWADLFPDLPLEAFRDSLRASMGLDPEFVTLPTYHAYEQGARALAVRTDSAGWAGVDRWFASPPSTACFLFPQRPCLDQAHPDPSGLFPKTDWWILRDGTVGPHYLDILLSVWRQSNHWLPPSQIRSRGVLQTPVREPNPDRIVQGWRGDHFQILRDRDGNLGLAWKTVWADTSAAANFLDAYQHLLVRKQRFDSLASRGPTYAQFHDAEAEVWDRVERFGTEVWIAEGVPGKTSFSFPRPR